MNRKGFAPILVILIVVAVAIAGGSYYALRSQTTAEPITEPSGSEQENVAVDETADWQTYRNEEYGLEFKLPAGWQQIESDASPRKGGESLTFVHKDAQYGTRPKNQEIRIMILDNPDQLSYEKLFALEDSPDLVEEYYTEEANTIIDGKPAKLVYELPEFKDGPIAFIPLEDRFIVVVSPREGVFGGANSFKNFLSTFIISEPLDVSNIAKPVQQQPIDNLLDWCAEAPTPGNCYAKLARTEKNPDPLWCGGITLQNSNNSEGFYYSYNNDCYMYVASKLRDISFCDNILGAGLFENNKINDEKKCKGWVNYELALHSNDASFCEKIDKDVWFNDGYGMDTVSQLECYVAVAVKVSNQSICDDITPSKTSTGGSITKEWCYYKYAVEKKDCSLVSENSPATKAQCESAIKD